MNRTRLAVLGGVLAVITVIVAIGSASADAAYRGSVAARLNGYTSGAPSQSERQGAFDAAAGAGDAGGCWRGCSGSRPALRWSARG